MTNKEWFRVLKLVVGSLIFALSVSFFVTPSNLNTGGVLGIAQLIAYFIPHSKSFDLSGIVNLLINIPLFLLAFRTISKRFCVKTLISVVVQMITLSLLPKLSVPIMDDMLSNCLVAAVLGGLGIGLCLQSSGCAGGMDILGVYFSKSKPNLSVGKLSMGLNIVLFSFCAFIWGLQAALYSMVYVVMMYFVCDKVHYQNINITAMIFTRNPELKYQIMERTGRGVTYWDGKGAYTDQDLSILTTCLNKYEVRRLRKVVNEVDPDAFVIINEGATIMGGFEKRM